MTLAPMSKDKYYFPDLSELPRDVRLWNRVKVNFPFLTKEEGQVFMPTHSDRLSMIKTLSRDGEQASLERLKFIRSARIENLMQYLIWSYLDCGQRLCYLTYCRDALMGNIVISMTLTNNLSAEQYLLADYHDRVYWNNYEITLHR